MTPSSRARLHLRRVFTLFVGTVSPGENYGNRSWCRRPRRGHHNPFVGLVFQDFDESDFRKCEETLRTLMLHPEVVASFSPTFYGSISPGEAGAPPQLIIAQFLEDLRPMYEDNGAVLVWQQGAVHAVNLSDAWDNCMDMRKLAQCTGCALPGLPCIRKHVTLPGHQLRLPVVASSDATWATHLTANYDDVREHFTPWKTEIAGFTYISPRYASKLEPFGPVVGLRHDMDLRDYGVRYAEASDSAEAAAKTRGFKKRECSNCVFGDTAKKTCWPYRNITDRCHHGAWSTDALIAASLAPVEKYLNATLTHGAAPDAWKQVLSGLLAVGGHTFKVENPHTNRSTDWHVTGLRLSRTDDTVRVRVIRTSLAGKYDPLFATKVFATLPEFFEFVGPRIQETFLAAKLVDDHTLALAAQLSATPALKSYVNRYYLQSTPQIDSVRSERSNVIVDWHLATRRGSVTISTFSDLRNGLREYTNLPLFPLFDAPK